MACEGLAGERELNDWRSGGESIPAFQESWKGMREESERVEYAEKRQN